MKLYFTENFCVFETLHLKHCNLQIQYCLQIAGNVQIKVVRELKKNTFCKIAICKKLKNVIKIAEL